MSQPSKIVEIWESVSTSTFEVKEDTSEVDGVHILARVEGPAFFPGTTSGNKVHYPIEAWEHALSDETFLEHLNSRLIFGTIGHDIDLGDDEIREGKFSHIVTKVWIDDNNTGRAEYLVLNTAPGRTLNTLLRAKSKMRVSTKASGLYESGSSNGVKTVIPSSFRLERIDFVREPGYAQAMPNLLESLNDNDISQDFTKELNMEKVVSILESRVTELTKKQDISESAAQELHKDIKELSINLAKSQLLLESYQGLGTAAALSETQSELLQYKAIGSVSEIHEALDAGEETIDDLSDTVSNLTDELKTTKESAETSAEEVAEYETAGSASEVKDALEQALALTDELQQYRDLGSVEELSQVLDQANQMTEEAESNQKSEIADQYGCSVDVVQSLLDKGLSLQETSDILSQIKGATPESDTESNPADVPVDPPADEPPADPVTGEEEEDELDADDLNESLSTRLFSQSRKHVPIVESAAKKTSSRAAKLMSIRK